MKQILPFNPADLDVQRMCDSILEAAPVKNLTHEEVLTTMRLIELQAFLAEGRYNQIVVH